MGIDADRFVYSIPQDCFCIICSLVLEDPVELIICGHHFCYKCFEQWSLEQQQKQELQEEIECPYCGIYADVTGVRKDKLAWNLIQNYNIYCENKKNGCESVYKLGFQDLHECEYKNKTLEEKEEEDVEKCSLCNLTFLENHDCLRELIKISKQKSIEITNLEHENNRLICKLTKREKEFVENLTLMESQYQDDNLKYNKEIRELRTRLAAMQGELGSKTGQSEVYTLNINLERLNGSLGFNIIGGTTENEKTSSGIFISRITEGGAADQPGKLQLHDRIIEVDGVNLSEATHELAVKAFRNSGDPVKMVIQRQIYKNKSCEAGTQTFGVIFAVTGDDACDKITNQDEVRNIKNNNKPSRWINPQELINSIHITKTDDEDDYIQNTDQIIKNKDQLIKDKDENNIIDDYDSAYDTLVTQKSSRNSRLSSDVESCSTNTQTPTLPEDSDSQGVVLRNNKNHSKSENRLSTFYVIPGDEKNNETDTSLLQDFITPQKIDGDFEEYEYEEVSLSKTTDEKYGLLLCYGGDENDVAVYVGDLEDSSVADLSGKIMVGDQIVRINDTHIRNVDEAYSMLQSNNKIILVVARAVYEPQTDYYDDAEETDLDMIDDIDDNLPTLSLPMHATNNIIQEEEENEDQNGHEDDKKADQVTDNQSTTSSSNDSAFIGLQRTKSLSPVTRSPVDFDLLRGRSSSVNDHHKIDKEKIPSIALSSALPHHKVEKESKYSLKNLRHKLGSHSSDKKDKRPNSHSDDSTELYKLPRCDSNSSNSSARSKRSSSKENKAEVSPNDVSKAKVKEQRQLSRMKAYLDSPSVIRHRINNNMLIKPTAQVRPPTNIVANEHSPYLINGISNVAPHVAPHVTPQVVPQMTSPVQHPVMRTPHPNIIYNNPVRSSLSESVLRSAMKPMNGKVRQPKHVQIDSHPNWNETEKRVWEEFKIIQSMEAKENLTNIQQNNNINNVEAEWRVRRSKDGKHIYIKKSNSTRNRVLKDREEQIQEERCGMTTDDDAFTVYQGQYWNKDQRKRQLSRHNERRKKLLQKAEAKQLYENKNERVINEMAQRNMFLPGNTVFDNYITVEEILSQRNRSGFLDGPVHVTTI